MLLPIALICAAAAPASMQDEFPAGTRVDTVVRGLELPWGLGFAPDGRVFFVERPGRIRVLENGRLRAEPWARVNVSGGALLGLALAPDFESSGHIFVAGAFFNAADSSYVNRVLRFTESRGRGSAPIVIADGIPSNRVHHGSTVAFGPDGKLYVTTGDAMTPDLAQDQSSLGGKILRLNPDGSVPDDNPFPGSAVYALGVRNPQGLAWHPETGELFATEHGPSNWPWENGRRDHDELNLIRPGANYGWPVHAGAGGDPRFADPLIEWTPAIAPGVLAWYAGSYEPWRNSLVLGALRGRHLRRLQLARGAGGVYEVILEERFQLPDSTTRIRGAFIEPATGAIWVTTSDRQLPGRAGPDDRIYRITLPRRNR